MMEPTPTAIMDREINEVVNSIDALSWLQKRIGMESDTTIIITCWIERTNSWPGGGTSFTEYSNFLCLLDICTPGIMAGWVGL